MISIGKPYITIEQIKNKMTDFDILSHYFGITKIPCIINSPLRVDNNPSFSLYSKDGINVLWTDFSTKQHGDTIDLLKEYWGESYREVLEHLWEDSSNITNTNYNYNYTKRNYRIKSNNNIKIECKVREWEDYDIEYWKSYGISLEWLKYANVYPISHKIIIKEDGRYVFSCDKLAYAYVEFKDGNTTLKIYQPYNKAGYKWSNNHDRSVISLWTKVPKYGDRIVICSSLKDALCLSCQTKIPALAVQGEGYSISNTAIKELKRRYKHIYILFDNDNAGIEDAIKLSEHTGFKNIVLPKINNSKDISDLYKSLEDKSKFKEIILNLFNYD